MMKRSTCGLLVALVLMASVPGRSSGDDGASDTAIGVAGGLVFSVLFGWAFGAHEHEKTHRLAISEEERTRRESIRARAVLAAPSALGGAGYASYASTEGHASIEAHGEGPRRRTLLLPGADWEAGH